MAFSKLLLAPIVMFLLVAGALSDDVAGDPEPSDSVLKSELEVLRSKISALESSVLDGSREIKDKEDNIIKLENIIKEKADSIKLLKSEIESFQKDDGNGEKIFRRAGAKVVELEKQIAKLNNEIGAQSKKRIALEARASDAEKKLQELSLRLETLQKTNEEQKLRIKKTRRAVEVAEEELMKAQLEATSKLKDLSEVEGAWFPTWFISYINHIQELAATNWKDHAKPAVFYILQKASEKSEQAGTWAGPHLHAAKTQWIPAVQEKLVMFKTIAEPYRQKISAKSIEIYEASLGAIEPHFVEVKELTDPYLQQAKNFSKPYINQVVLATKPHYEKALVLLLPYKEHVVRSSGKFLRTARTYSSQVQANIHEQLKKHELTKPHASKELAHFITSALLAFPVLLLYRLLSATFCKKAKRQIRNAQASQKPRRPKRRHTDK